MRESGTVIAEIQERIVSLIESQTDSFVLRKTAHVLAGEFGKCKRRQDLADNYLDGVDVDNSARLILKRQILHLYSHRNDFTPIERVYLNRLAQLVAKL